MTDLRQNTTQEKKCEVKQDPQILRPSHKDSSETLVSNVPHCSPKNSEIFLICDIFKYVTLKDNVEEGKNFTAK